MYKLSGCLLQRWNNSPRHLCKVSHFNVEARIRDIVGGEARGRRLFFPAVWTSMIKLCLNLKTSHCCITYDMYLVCVIHCCFLHAL